MRVENWVLSSEQGYNIRLELRSSQATERPQITLAKKIFSFALKVAQIHTPLGETIAVLLRTQYFDPDPVKISSW